MLGRSGPALEFRGQAVEHQPVRRESERWRRGRVEIPELVKLTVGAMEFAPGHPPLEPHADGLPVRVVEIAVDRVHGAEFGRQTGLFGKLTESGIADVLIPLDPSARDAP